MFSLNKLYILQWDLFINQKTVFVERKTEFKGSQMDVFCPKAIVYCYLEFKLRYLKNLKLFSIRVK